MPAFVESVRYYGKLRWLTQSQMATLFGCSTDNIGLHLKNVYAVGELSREATTEDFSVVRKEGARQVRRNVTCYNLDAIISVGYRVNSILGVKFRQWATTILKEYLLKGYSFNARMNQLEDKVDRRLAQHDQAIVDLKEKVDFFVQTKEPPLQGIFYQGSPSRTLAVLPSPSRLPRFCRNARRGVLQRFRGVCPREFAGFSRSGSCPSCRRRRRSS